MHNHHLPIFFALVLLSLSTVASADDELAEGRGMIQAERQEMFRAELHMTEDEAEKFWPIYSTYREYFDGIMCRYGEMIANYVRRYDDADLSDEYADEMIDTYFGIKAD